MSNQHSNGLLDLESISETDAGQYICRGENRGVFAEEIVTLELIERGSPPSIVILPNTANGRLQIPRHSYQTIECLNQDPSSYADITWRRADMVRSCFFFSIKFLHRIEIFQDHLDLSKTVTLFPPNLPLGLEHSGTYICTATNQYGSSTQTITLDGNIL